MSHRDTNPENESICDIPDVTRGLKLRKGAHICHSHPSTVLFPIPTIIRSNMPLMNANKIDPM